MHNVHPGSPEFYQQVLTVKARLSEVEDLLLEHKSLKEQILRMFIDDFSFHPTVVYQALQLWCDEKQYRMRLKS